VCWGGKKDARAPGSTLPPPPHPLRTTRTPVSTRWTRHSEDTRVHLVDRPSLRRASRRSDSGVHRMDTSVHEATLLVHGGDHLRGLLGRLHLRRRAVRALRRRGLSRAPPRLERRVVVILDLGDRAG